MLVLGSVNKYKKQDGGTGDELFLSDFVGFLLVGGLIFSIFP